MFSKQLRFNLRQDRSFFKNAKRKSYPLFQVFTEPFEQGPVFAVVVPKKVCPKSTDRHKLLRQMRMLLTKQSSRFGKNKVVLVMFRSSFGKTFKDLELAVSQIND